jgi:hypothetical protein
MNSQPLSFTPASPGTAGVFVLIVVHVVAAFGAAVYYAYRINPALAQRRTILALIGLGIWIGGLSVLVASGGMSALPNSGLPLFFGSVLVVSAVTGLSPLGRRIAVEVPLAALVGFQAFRLPLELVLHRWALEGTIPSTMTWSGENWDIVSGILALIAAPFANRHRSAAWAVNIIGGILLLNVIRVAVLSSPLPFAWQVSPPLLLALHLPYAWIGPVCVGGALVGHIVLTRALLRRAGNAS